MTRDHIRRRDFISLVGGAAVAWPRAARAQQPAMPVVGVITAAWLDPSAGERFRSLRQGVSEVGFVEGRNVAFEYRAAEGHNDRLPALAVDLVRRQVSVIVVSGIPGVMAARAATTTIPIVFQGGFDPVAVGVVASLNRPGGNVTGITSLGLELGPKRLELLHELLPAAKSFALLVNPTNPTSAATQTRDLQAAPRTLGLQLHVLPASSEGDFEGVFASVAQLRTGGLVISNDALFIAQGETLGALALRHAVPAIFQFSEFPAAGGLMGYGANNLEGYRLQGVYAGRILKGEKPADLPVQQATRVELVINMKTAKALGLTFPLTLLGRADEVIE